MALPVTRVILRDKPGNCMPWVHHGTPGWYIGPYLKHYICMQCYMPSTDIVCITDKMQYTPKAFDFPNTKTEYYLQQSIGDIIEIIKDSPKTLPFLSYGHTTNNLINKIAHIIQRSTAQTCLPILTLPPLLLESQTPNPLPVIISHTAAPAPRHIWELMGDYLDFIVVMVFYLFCWRTKRILVTAITGFKIYILIQSLMLFI